MFAGRGSNDLLAAHQERWFRKSPPWMRETAAWERGAKKDDGKMKERTINPFHSATIDVIQ
jgi:hypothetical protein